MQSNYNRALHGLAGQVVTTKHAHQYLQAMALEKFGRRSLHDVTDEEAKKIQELLHKEVRSQQFGLYGASNNGIDRISTDQLIAVKQMQKKLAWSDKYLEENLLPQRFDETKVETMPRWKAVRLVMLMVQRLNAQRKKEMGESKR